LQNSPVSRKLSALSIRVLGLQETVHGPANLKGDGLDINIGKRAQVQLVHLKGPLRMGPALDSLRQTLEEALGHEETRIAVNLSEVPMIDSSGIGLLVRFLASARQRGGNIKLVSPSDFAVKTLRLVGVLNLFEVFPDDDAAVESF
jgi:anti-sigma B factor antagonist